ncbi:MAG: hypothetical protein WAQ52_15050 [Terriglobales bacterium]
MHRWIARLLVLLMLAPAFGPLALARAAHPEAPHCLRQPAQPVMQCHHGMAMASEPQSSEASFRAVGSCCQNHDCCRGLAAPQWAQPQTRLFLRHGVLTDKAPSAPRALLTPVAPLDRDSARAPPRT